MVDGNSSYRPRGVEAILEEAGSEIGVNIGLPRIDTRDYTRSVELNPREIQNDLRRLARITKEQKRLVEGTLFDIIAEKVGLVSHAGPLERRLEEAKGGIGELESIYTKYNAHNNDLRRAYFDAMHSMNVCGHKMKAYGKAIEKFGEEEKNIERELESDLIAEAGNTIEADGIRIGLLEQIDNIKYSKDRTKLQQRLAAEAVKLNSRALSNYEFQRAQVERVAEFTERTIGVANLYLQYVDSIKGSLTWSNEVVQKNLKLIEGLGKLKITVEALNDNVQRGLNEISEVYAKKDIGGWLMPDAEEKQPETNMLPIVQRRRAEQPDDRDYAVKEAEAILERFRKTKK